MSTVRVFKKGESLYREGEKAQSVFLIQSGSVSLTLHRNKNNIDLCTLGGSQIAGEHALSGIATHPHTATAMAETKAVELPVEALKAQIEAAPQLLKVLTKSFSDKLKVVMKELQSARLEKDNTPCPAEQTAKIFGTLFHTVKSKGEVGKDGVVKAPWPLMKSYAQKVFLEHPKRFEMAVNIFVKLGFGKFEMVKPEDDPNAAPEIGFVHFTDISLIEQFFEFYQYYYFKGGKTDLLKTDERMINLVSALLELGAAEQMDRHGTVRLDYSKVLEKMKQKFNFQLNNDHFLLLESKGLFVKRQSTDGSVFVIFDFREFERTFKVWKVLREVERWNEKGYVDPNEPVEVAKKIVTGGSNCPSCQAPYEGTPKFCAECGHKLTAAA